MLIPIPYRPPSFRSSIFCLAQFRRAAPSVPKNSGVGGKGLPVMSLALSTEGAEDEDSRKKTGFEDPVEQEKETSKKSKDL